MKFLFTDETKLFFFFNLTINMLICLAVKLKPDRNSLAFNLKWSHSLPQF